MKMYKIKQMIRGITSEMFSVTVMIILVFLIMRVLFK